MELFDVEMQLLTLPTFDDEDAPLRPREAIPAVVGRRVADASRPDAQQVERVDLHASFRVILNPPSVNSLSVLVPAYGKLYPRAETGQ